MAFKAPIGILLTALMFLVSDISAVSYRLKDGRQEVALQSNSTSNERKTALAIKGDDVVLKCVFDVYGWSTIQWVKSTREDISETVLPDSVINSTGGSVSIATLQNTTESDEGNYSCILTTLRSGSVSYNFELAVKGKSWCDESTCSVNGTCVEAIDGYNCVCDTGFVGTHCEHVDPCLNSPCLNRGTCNVNGADFNCTCVTGYGGSKCENEVCTTGICGSGSCSDITGKIKCNCNSRYAGNRCQYRCSFSHRLSYCRAVTCKITTRNGQRHNEYCSCDYSRPDYSGTKCMMKSDVRNECNDPDICNRRGSCTNQIFGYRCSCRGLASGTNCQLYNECGESTNLCDSKYGGTCTDLTVGYRCRNCPSGQSGEKCQFKKEPCEVTCYPTSMTAECDMLFMSRNLRRIPIYSNSRAPSCRLKQPSSYSSYSNYQRRRNQLKWKMTISYSDCGTEIEYGEENVTYKNRLVAGGSKVKHEKFNSVMTRKAGHFSFELECTLALLRNVTEEMNDYSLLLNETLDLRDTEHIEIITSNVAIYNDSDFYNQTSSYIIGDRLYVKISINVNRDPTLSRGYELHPVACYATSDSTDIDKSRRYMMLEDGCVLDETFRFESVSDGDKLAAYFSFESFSFKVNPGKLYLHCASKVCVEDHVEETCDIKCKESDKAEADISTTESPNIKATIDRTSRMEIEVIPGKPNPDEQTAYSDSGH